jgi:hypothetical protein
VKSGVDGLVDRWLNEPGFRERLLDDPDKTVRGAGITLSADEWASLTSALVSISDEELRPRVSKRLATN